MFNIEDFYFIDGILLDNRFNAITFRLKDGSRKTIIEPNWTDEIKNMFEEFSLILNDPKILERGSVYATSISKEIVRKYQRKK